MQIQGTGKIGSTKRKFHLSGVPLIESIDCSVNPSFLIIGKVDGYIKENKGNKYLVFTSTDGNKKVSYYPFFKPPSNLHPWT